VEVETEIDAHACELSVNALLPPDIAICRLRQVDDSFHARYSAVGRRYRYYLCCRKRPLLFKRVWMVFYTMDWERVGREISAIRGEHDFSTFCASGGGAKHARCNVTHTSIDREDDLLVFTIEANRFVYSMVRSLAGTLVDIGRGRISDSMTALIACRDRRRAGQTAPACGLVLDNVIYRGVD
jgi:tRNA pseudouridine38-40 synthase